MFAAVLARAALEIPNPPRPLFGIDPRREASKARLIAATMFYKAKVGVSNFVLRRLLVRVFGRAGLRSWIPFISVPVTACWDAFVCRRALREARLRAMGPSAARGDRRAPAGLGRTEVRRRCTRSCCGRSGRRWSAAPTFTRTWWRWSRCCAAARRARAGGARRVGPLAGADPALDAGGAAGRGADAGGGLRVRWADRQEGVGRAGARIRASRDARPRAGRCWRSRPVCSAVMGSIARSCAR
jgi:hypothetical protein